MQLIAIYRGYDLIAFFDCLHDMGDPSGAASHVLKTLKPDGTWMIVVTIRRITSDLVLPELSSCCLNASLSKSIYFSTVFPRGD